MLEPLSNESNILNLIIKKYYRGSLDFILKPEDVQEITWSQQEQFVNATINCPLIKKYPVKAQFSRLFLKKLIQYLEDCQDVHDELYTYLCLAMQNNNDENFCYRHYIIGNNLNNIVTIKETNNMVVNGTTGMRTWEAAIMLADWALCNREVFNKKKVLELGSGVGFTGITIASFCQPANIILSDCHEQVLKAIENNIAINFPSWDYQKCLETATFNSMDQTIGVMELDWNDISDVPKEVCPDVIIGADIIYDPTILDPLYNVIESFLHRNKKVEIFISGVIRNEKTLNMFLKRIEDSLSLKYSKLVQQENVYIDWDSKMQRYLLHINKKDLN